MSKRGQVTVARLFRILEWIGIGQEQTGPLIDPFGNFPVDPVVAQLLWRRPCRLQKQLLETCGLRGKNHTPNESFLPPILRKASQRNSPAKRGHHLETSTGTPAN